MHGHDEAALQGLARLLEKLGLEAIVLREQPDKGRTVIEKFEDSADEVGFAVVLLTPDDIGGIAVEGSQSARARQNVILRAWLFHRKAWLWESVPLPKRRREIPQTYLG